MATSSTPTVMLDSRQRIERIIKATSHYVVLVLSLLLIVFISYDTFAGINFLENHLYMTFQFWVCIVFLADFFLEWYTATDRKGYVAGHWFYFLISIPYLNIISGANIQFTPEELYFVRFVPLIRGAYALAVVVGYFSTNRAYSMLTQYAAILLSIIYFSSIIFFYKERGVNPDVNTYWDALYWAAENCDTVGSYINAMTVTGKILGVILAVSGMMMLPLFTVYITAKVKDYNDKRQKQEAQLHEALEAEKIKREDNVQPTTENTQPTTDKKS